MGNGAEKKQGRPLRDISLPAKNIVTGSHPGRTPRNQRAGDGAGSLAQITIKRNKPPHSPTNHSDGSHFPGTNVLREEGRKRWHERGNQGNFPKGKKAFLN